MGIFGPSHYDWLDENLMQFVENLKETPLEVQSYINRGIINAHGDKCSCYKYDWDKVGIPFEHGVAIFLLSYLKPFSDEVRETENGWVDVRVWVEKNYSRFLPYLPPAYPKEKVND